MGFHHLVTGDEHMPVLRKSDALLIGLCQEGAGVLLLEEKIYSFQIGSIIIVPPNKSFCIQTPQHAASSWEILFVSGSLIPPFLPTQPILLDEPVQRTMTMLMEEWYQARPYTQHAQKLLLELLFLQLQRASNSSQGREISPLSPQQRRAMENVYPAMARIGSNCAEKLSIPILAELCHLSVAQFQRTFHLATGQSPHAYLISVRLKLAASLLRSTDLTILAISEQIGFDCISSFNRHFIKAYQISPRAYRIKSRTLSLPAKEELRNAPG